MPEAVQRLLEQNPDATELEKKTVEVSVLFLDIAAARKLSEQLEPRQLNRLVQTHSRATRAGSSASTATSNETAGTA